MDESRYRDLKRLQGVIDNPEKSRFVRRQAEKALRTILAQMRDPKLRHLRLKLIQAHQAGDQDGVMRIEYQIKNYERKHWEPQFEAWA